MMLVPTAMATGEARHGLLAGNSPAATAKEVWRFSAIPRLGEPGSDTWHQA